MPPHKTNYFFHLTAIAIPTTVAAAPAANNPAVAAPSRTCA